MSMKLMSLDTLALQQELVGNGLEIEKANEIASALTEVMRVSEFQVASKNDLALLQVSLVKLLDSAETERLILSDAMQAWTDLIDFKQFTRKIALMLYISLTVTIILVFIAYYFASNVSGI